jgi:hypothetical protein
MNPIIDKLDSTLFDWSSWRSGSIHDLDIIRCRYELITSPHGKSQLRRYAVGWCYGENLMCRCKKNEIATMFEKDEIRFWFHLRRKEFEEVFCK